MNYSVFRSGFPDFSEAIPFPAKAIAGANQKCTKRAGNKSHSTTIRGGYKIPEKTVPPKYRLRVGEYRIIYMVKDDVVHVIEVFKRGRGYQAV